MVRLLAALNIHLQYINENAATLQTFHQTWQKKKTTQTQIITAVQNDLTDALRILGMDPIKSGPAVHIEEDDEELSLQMLAGKQARAISL